MIALTSTTFAFAQPITVSDVGGRTVALGKNPRKVILGEGRMIYTLALLDQDDPFQRDVGWRDDMIKFDPDAIHKYLAVFPSAVSLPNFGGPYSGEWNLEAAIVLGTEPVVMNLGNLQRVQESCIIEKPEEAGVATVFVDFRQDPTQNAVPSIQLLGRIFGKRDEADSFTDFYQRQMKEISTRVSAIPADERPIVFIENPARYNANRCRRTYGAANLGRLVDLAGGRNRGSPKFSGFSTSASLEANFVDDPGVVIGTGANGSEANPATKAVLFGYEATEGLVQKRLRGLAPREGGSELSTVKTGRFPSVYHQFYDSPHDSVAMQTIAKCLHPESFEDVNPEATMRELHDAFLPIDYSGVSWGTLNAEG